MISVEIQNGIIFFYCTLIAKWMFSQKFIIQDEVVRVVVRPKVSRPLFLVLGPILTDAEMSRLVPRDSDEIGRKEKKTGRVKFHFFGTGFGQTFFFLSVGNLVPENRTLVPEKGLDYLVMKYLCDHFYSDLCWLPDESSGQQLPKLISQRGRLLVFLSGKKNVASLWV